MDAEQIHERFDKACVDTRAGKTHRAIESINKLLAGPVQTVYGQDSFVEIHMLHEIAEQYLSLSERTPEGATAALEHSRKAVACVDKALAMIRRRQQKQSDICVFGKCLGIEAEFHRQVALRTARDLQPELYAERDDFVQGGSFMVSGALGAYACFFRFSNFSLLRLLGQQYTEIRFEPLDAPGRARAAALVVEGLQLMRTVPAQLPIQLAVEGRIVEHINCSIQLNLLASDKRSGELIYAAFSAVAPHLAERNFLHKNPGGRASASGTDRSGRRFVAAMRSDVSEQMHASEVMREAKRLESIRLRGGLRSCALGSCGRREESSGQFKMCAACKSVWYCCVEHSKENWPAHKADCKRIAKGQGAAAGGDGGSGASAGAAAEGSPAAAAAPAGSSAPAAPGGGASATPKKKAGKKGRA